MAAFLWAGPTPARATALQFTLDTSILSGTAAYLAFDFIGNDGIAGNNTVVVSNFYTSGTLGNSRVSGGVTGALVPGPVQLTDGGFFNEFLQELTLGDTVRFTLNLTEEWAASGSLTPDSFSLFLLDDSLFPLFATTDDPDPAFSGGKLFQVDSNGTPSGDQRVFAPLVAGVSWTVTPAVAVPTPSTAWLFGVGLLGGVVGWRNRVAIQQQN